VNGGGSARSSLFTTTSSSTEASTSASLVRETPTETRQRVQSTLGYLEVPTLIIDNNNAATSIYTKSQQRQPPLLTNFPRTEYHVVPPMNYTTGAVAGEKVENMVW